MKIEKPKVLDLIFFTPDNGMSIEQMIEYAGRTCYKSEDKITDDSADSFVEMLRDRGHHAMLEFGYAVAKISADRGLSHELVRHRICSFGQESTRYCNYSKGKFDSTITVVEQPGIENPSWANDVWESAMEKAERYYLELIKLGVSPQIARSVLPIGLKTEIVVGANLREWRHIFNLRCSKAAHPIIRGVMLELLERFYHKVPVMYADLAEKYLPELEY